MTSHPRGNTALVACSQKNAAMHDIEDLFVSIDLAQDTAYVVHDCTSGLRWQEVTRGDAELLVAMGARSMVAIGLPHKGHEVPRKEVIDDTSPSVQVPQRGRQLSSS